MSRPIVPGDPGPVRPLGEAASMGLATASTITGQLVGRWIAEFADLIRDPVDPVADVTVGRWELLEGHERERLTQIGYELLVRLDQSGAIVKGRTQRLVPLIRDHTGAVVTRATTGRPREGAPQGVCTCGDPNRLGVAHWIGRPCYAVDEPTPGPVQLTEDEGAE